MAKKGCSKCGNEFEARGNRSKYCSIKCQYGIGVCRTCGKEFVKKSNTTGDYCSSRCWYNSEDFKDVEYKKCSHCGVSKPHTEFPYSGGKGELHGWCKDCHSQSYEENQSKKRQSAIKYAIGDFPERIKKYRLEQGMTQQEFGKKVGIGATQIRHWEKGTSLPHPKKVKFIFDLFGWEVPDELNERQDFRLPLVIGICPYCGNSFPIYRTKTVFCSRICNNRYHSSERSSTWRGGKYESGCGYIKVKMPDHPNSDTSGYIPEHRLIMERILGRHLLLGEKVHHKNGIRDDNRPENLELWTTDHKDPPGVRVSDKIADDILSQPEISELPEEIRGRIKDALYRVANKQS